MDFWNEQLAGPIRGQLTTKDGCIALHSADASAYEYLTLIWPPQPDYEIEVVDQSYRILDSTGGVRAAEGDFVQLTGGGSSAQYRSQLSAELMTPIPDECSAPFWIVGSLEREASTITPVP